MLLAKNAAQRIMTVVRSMGVGVLATVIDLTLLLVLVDGIGLSARVASPIALAIGVGFQFVGNKVIAFQDTSSRWGSQAAQFLGVEALGFVANVVLFDVLVRWLPAPYVAVRLLSTSVVYFGLCLPLWSRIFRAQLKEISPCTTSHSS